MTIPTRPPLIAQVSATAPLAALSEPGEIQLWFQRPGRGAFVLCCDGWREWSRGVAIKAVCCKGS